MLAGAPWWKAIGKMLLAGAPWWLSCCWLEDATEQDATEQDAAGRGALEETLAGCIVVDLLAEAPRRCCWPRRLGGDAGRGAVLQEDTNRDCQWQKNTHLQW